jgi:Uma2 family endonuclease
MEITFNSSSSFQLSGDYIIIKPNISEEEFWEITNEDTNFELIDGVLVIHSPASTEHEEIFQYLSHLIAAFLEEPKYGRILGSRLVMRLSEKWNPEPDLMVLLPENYNRIKPTKIDGPADLVVEILSAATRELDLTKKVPKYLQMGVKEIWLIDPSKQSLSVYNSKDVIIMDDSSSSEYIPSFLSQIKIQINWIWNRDQNPAIKIIQNWLRNR